MAIPNSIISSDILTAIVSVDQGKESVPSRRRSTGYCLEQQEDHYRHFPPKEIIRIAARARTGNPDLMGFFGGDEANDFCESRGFVIVPCGGAPHR